MILWSAVIGAQNLVSEILRQADLQSTGVVKGNHIRNHKAANIPTYFIRPIEAI